MITVPGRYEMPEADYHADPVAGGSLSSSVARHILARTPAEVAYERDHPVHKDAYDLGTVVHKALLGIGPEIVEVDADSWQTKAARQARDEAR